MDDLRPLDHFPFEFYGDTFTAVLANDRHLYVPLHDMCLTLDVQTNGQIRRIRENEAIADALVPLVITRAYGDEDVQTGEMLCLRLDRLPYWLGTMQPNRIKGEKKREQVVRFQCEFADVAWAAFRSQILPPDTIAELDASLSPTQQEYLRLMDEAAALRQGATRHEERLSTLEQRVADLEARLVGTDFINPAQMKEYMDMVGIVAHLLRKKGRGNEGVQGQGRTADWGHPGTAIAGLSGLVIDVAQLLARRNHEAIIFAHVNGQINRLVGPGCDAFHQ
jgi:hypothetical protein